MMLFKKKDQVCCIENMKSTLLLCSYSSVKLVTLWYSLSSYKFYRAFSNCFVCGRHLLKMMFQELQILVMSLKCIWLSEPKSVTSAYNNLHQVSSWTNVFFRSMMKTCKMNLFKSGESSRLFVQIKRIKY